MRPHLHLALVASATFAVAGTVFAQSRGVTRVGPAESAAFWVHDDGTVEVNDAMGRAVFRDIEAYLASDAFVRNGKRCGLPAMHAGPWQWSGGHEMGRRAQLLCCRDSIRHVCVCVRAV